MEGGDPYGVFHSHMNSTWETFPQSITCLCQVLLLLHEEVKAKPLLMLERARRMGREGVSPLPLVFVGKDPHKHQ